MFENKLKLVILLIILILLLASCQSALSTSATDNVDTLKQQIAQLQDENTQLKEEIENLKSTPTSSLLPLPTQSATPTQTLESIPTESSSPFPIEISTIKLGNNSIGTPEIRLVIKNIGDKPIDAFNFIAECYDNYGDRVFGYSYNDNFKGTYQGENGVIKAGKISSSITWDLYGFDMTTKVRVALIKCHEKDGNTYELNLNDYTWVEK